MHDQETRPGTNSSHSSRHWRRHLQVRSAMIRITTRLEVKLSSLRRAQLRPLPCVIGQHSEQKKAVLVVPMGETMAEDTSWP